MPYPEKHPKLSVARMNAEPTEARVNLRPAVQLKSKREIFSFLTSGAPQKSSLLLVPDSNREEVSEIRATLEKDQLTNDCSIKIQIPAPDVTGPLYYDHTASSILTKEVLGKFAGDYKIIRDLSDICLTHRANNGLVVDVMTMSFFDVDNGDDFLGYEIRLGERALSEIASPFQIDPLFRPALEVAAAFLNAQGIRNPESIALIPYTLTNNHPSFGGFDPKSAS